MRLLRVGCYERDCRWHHPLPGVVARCTDASPRPLRLLPFCSGYGHGNYNNQGSSSQQAADPAAGAGAGAGGAADPVAPDAAYGAEDAQIGAWENEDTVAGGEGGMDYATADVGAAGAPHAQPARAHAHAPLAFFVRLGMWPLGATALAAAGRLSCCKALLCFLVW